MKTIGGISILLLLGFEYGQGLVGAFAPSAFQTRRSTTLSFSPIMDLSHLPDLPNHIMSLQDAFSSISLADLDIDALTSSAPNLDVNTVTSSAASTVQAIDPSGDVADAAQKNGNGWFGFLTGPTMSLLMLIHSALVAVGVSSDSWGVSIIALTVVIKLVTFPLTKAQLESTNKMQVSASARF
jgi:YidC/Oxa1 family membrane protein insertase